jgi:hypothetical protein
VIERLGSPIRRSIRSSRRGWDPGFRLGTPLDRHFAADAANLCWEFSLRTSQRHRHRQQAFRTVGETFGDAVVAMIDRGVHHDEVVSMKGDIYRLQDRDPGSVPTDRAA